ncbi:hypothetical protein [Streptomyces sp. NPDC102437]|uniref:hypothetical protein n=1 Tax=Streptomyces sp. NPDC102437 TaxID=3366175 RepID=UPI003805ED34
MPLIVDPTAPQVTPPDRVVSPDGWLGAIVDEPWAGVALSYNGNTPPAARNRALNPSVEVDLSNTLVYAGSARDRITTDARYGTACIQHSATGTTSGSQYLCEAVPAGATIRVSAWVRVPGTGTTVFFSFRNATTTHGTATAGVPPVVDDWVRMTATYTVPVGVTVDRIAVAYTAPAGTVWLSDGMMIETGVDGPSEYVDGDQPGCVWEGAAHASPSDRVTAVPTTGDIIKVRIVRQDPGGGAPVPVRSADPAWAVAGVGTAYDHEAPLGVPVIYTATPIYADGSTGPASSLAVTVPAPAPGQERDLWLKSLDDPSLSLRAMLVDRPEPASAGRQSVADVPGSPFRVVAFDEHAAESYTVTIDVPPEQADQVRALLRSGVLLAQTRPGYVITPDAYHVPADITGPTPTGRLGSSEGYQFSWVVEPVARPDTEGQPLRVPGWSWDILAEQISTWDAVAASYSIWASAAMNGLV